MKYMAYITDSFALQAHKNQLEREVFAVLLRHDRQILTADARHRFKERITKAIAKANKDHPNDAPFGTIWLTAYKTDHDYPDERLALGNASRFNFKLLAIKK